MSISADLNYETGIFKGFVLENIVSSNNINGITSSSTTTGRRGSLHVYPYQDFPFFEDMGRKARRFSMEIHFIGDDHMQVTNDFLNLVEEDPAEGFLVHPQRGRHLVIPIEVTATDSEDKIGLTSVSITFIEAGGYLYPNNDRDQFGNFNDIDLNSLIDQILNFDSDGIFESSIPNDIRPRAVDTLVQSFNNASPEELRQIVQGQDPFNILGNDSQVTDAQKIIALTSQINALNTNSAVRTGIITPEQGLDYRDDILSNLSTLFDNYTSSNNPEAAEVVSNLAFATLSNYEGFANSLTPSIRRQYNTSLPAAMVAQDLGSPHSDVLRYNDYIDPIFMSTVIQISGGQLSTNVPLTVGNPNTEFGPRNRPSLNDSNAPGSSSTPTRRPIIPSRSSPVFNANPTLRTFFPGEFN